jgi:glutamate/tyrosine decarboxylase-like PLP-dependent enzyme
LVPLLLYLKERLAMTELELMHDAERRSRDYLATVAERRVFPGAEALNDLGQFHEAFPEDGHTDVSTLALLDDTGSPGTVVSNGPNYFGFVIGATFPVASAAERLALAWDQCASSFDNSPTAATIEKVASEWMLDVLNLPRDSGVSFGTSATACGLACLVAARRSLLANKGWDFDSKGLAGAPNVRVVVSELAHITVIKALRVLGFGTDNLISAAVDNSGRIDPQQLPDIDDLTILCLQAGEVNTGAFDPFVPLIGRAREAGAWVHVDGAFGLWARANPKTAYLTEGIDAADSWTCDGHKWLNTPYDGAVAICRDSDLMAGAMNSDAAYSMSSKNSQKNLGLEFSRRARGIAIWAALRTLGRAGVAALVERHCVQARRLADGLSASGFTVLNKVFLNQVLVQLDTDEATRELTKAAADSGKIWFGSSVWQGRVAFRMSVSSWRTRDEDIDSAIEVLCNLRDQLSRSAKSAPSNA